MEEIQQRFIDQIDHCAAFSVPVSNYE